MENQTLPEQPETRSEIDSEESDFGFTKSDQLFLIVVISICVVYIGVNQSRYFFSAKETIEVQRLPSNVAQYEFDINSGTWVEWMQLDGIGELTARKIVEDREMNGPFESIDDVQRVKGIGPATLEKMKPHLRCESCP